MDPTNPLCQPVAIMWSPRKTWIKPFQTKFQGEGTMDDGWVPEPRARLWKIKLGDRSMTATKCLI